MYLDSPCINGKYGQELKLDLYYAYVNQMRSKDFSLSTKWGSETNNEEKNE
jgi:hypothetical protein